MTADEIINAIDDTEILQRLEVAKDDLAEAANHEQNSERHQECFAAVYLLAIAAGKRGLLANKLH